MKISDIMTEKNVVLGLKANSKRQLLQELSDKAAEITGINERTIFDIVLERENLGSTGFRTAASPNSTKFTACLQN